MNGLTMRMVKVAVVLAVLPLAASGCYNGIYASMGTSAANSFATAIGDALAQYVVGLF
jgi:hypothetical protein